MSDNSKVQRLLVTHDFVHKTDFGALRLHVGEHMLRRKGIVRGHWSWVIKKGVAKALANRGLGPNGRPFGQVPESGYVVDGPMPGILQIMMRESIVHEKESEVREECEKIISTLMSRLL
jgi:hypothetical protein